MAKYIPDPDSRFDEWFKAFAAYCSANHVAFGIKTNQNTRLTNAVAAWSTAYEEHLAAQTTARAKTKNKVDRRDEAEDIIRMIAGIIQANPDVTDEQRRLAGLSVAGDQPSSVVSEDATGIGLNAPLLLAPDFSQRGRCTLHFGPNPANGRQNAKPRGVRGAKIWYAEGGIPAQEEGWLWLADDTTSPYLHVVGNMQPVTVAYRAQYFDSHMNLGPYSDPVVVTITA